MRVLYIDHTIKLSGAAISLGTLIRHLPVTVEPHFLLRSKSETAQTLCDSDRPMRRERLMPLLMTTWCAPSYGPTMMAWHLAKSAAAPIRLGRLIREWKIDLVHLNESVLVPYALACKQLGVPVVLHARAPVVADRVTQLTMSLAADYRRFALFAIDQETADSLPTNCQPRTHVVHNPIELGPSPSATAVTALRSKWGFGPDDIVIGQVGSLHTSKGVWDVLDLAAQIAPGSPNAKFVLIGDLARDAGEGAALTDAVRSRGLSSIVFLPGYETNLALTWAAIDIGLCLFGRHLKGVGRSVYEAGLAGKPVIATLPDPNTTLTIRHGISGLVHAPDDSNGIRTSLLSLIKSAPLRLQIGESARVELSSRHDPKAVAARCTALYESLLATPN